MGKLKWIVPAILAVALGVGLGLYMRQGGPKPPPATTTTQAMAPAPPAASEADKAGGAVEAKRLGAELSAARGELDRTKGELSRLQNELAQCRSEHQKLAARPQSPWQRSKPIYFRPGSAKLGPKDRKLITKVVGQIKAEPAPEVRVEGHSDKVPMTPATKRRYGDNLGLSVVRSLEVARELFRQGVPVERVIVIGYGTTKPMPAPAGKKVNNRRAVILHMPQPPS